jgi:hypothetical protein
MKTKFPYECTVRETGRKFIPMIIDYEKQRIWWQKGLEPENGAWLEFKEVEFRKISTFNELSNTRFA